MNKTVLFFVYVVCLPFHSILQENNFFECKKTTISNVLSYGIGDKSTTDFVVFLQQLKETVIIYGYDRFVEKSFAEGFSFDDRQSCNLILAEYKQYCNSETMVCYPGKNFPRPILLDQYYKDYFQKKDPIAFDRFINNLSDAIDFSDQLWPYKLQSQDSTVKTKIIKELVTQYELSTIDSLMLSHVFFSMAIDEVIEFIQNHSVKNEITVVRNLFGTTNGIKDYLFNLPEGDTFFFIAKKGSYSQKGSLYAIKNKIKNHKRYKDYDIVAPEDLPRKLKFSKSVVLERDTLLSYGVKFIYIKELDNCLW